MDRPSKIGIILKRYLANCNMHGIRYIVEDGLHWTERLFWLIICAICWYGCVSMVRNSLDGYYTRPVAFTAETTYLEWQTPFPSVSVCLRPHPEAADVAGSLYKKKFGSTVQSMAWTWLFSGYVRTRNSMSAHFSKLTPDDVVDFYKKSIINCTRLLNECSWRSAKFNCCEKFLPLKTATGLCYVFNSRHVKTDEDSDKFIMNQNTGVGYLSIGLTDLAFVRGSSQIRVFIHNNLAIPSAASNDAKEIDTAQNKVSTVYFTLENTFNEAGLKRIPPDRRGCRFPDETENFHVYRWYSNNGCILQLQMENMLRICGCVTHLFPHTTRYPVCNYTGIICLSGNGESIMGYANLGKRCLPDCEDIVMRHYQNIKANQIHLSQSEMKQGIHLELLALPTSRFRRYVVRSLLDLVGDELNIGVPGSMEQVTMTNETDASLASNHILMPKYPEILTFEDIKYVVAQAEGPEAKLISYDIQKYSDEKLGFYGSHKQLRVKISKTDSSAEETKVYFVKAVPHEVPTQAEYMGETKIFIKEVLFFNYIVPELEKFYPGERWGPKCYLAHNEVIVLEELRLNGFTMREKLFDEESVNAALSALARMHAASLGAEARLGKPLNEVYPEAFQETGFQEYGKQFMWYTAGVKVAVAVAEQLGLDPSQIPEACQEVFEANKPSRSLQNVVSHADPWSNNFMFNNGKPPLCYVVDFQLVRYSPPGYDIAMLLYLTASQKLRETRGDAMVRHYYSTLCETLGMYDPPVEPPSFSSILKGMEEQKLGALVTAMIYLPTVLLDGALGATVMDNPVTYAKYVYTDRRDVVLSNMKRDVVYDTRIKEVVTELHEFSQRLHTLPVPC